MTPNPSAPPSFTLPLPDLVALGGAPLYLTGEDTLLLTVFNAAAGVTVELRGRTLAFGETKPSRFGQPLTPTTNRAASTLVVNPGDGWLLGCEAIVTAGTPIDGQTWARIALIRGGLVTGAESFTLASDTITIGKAVSWPGGFVRGPQDGAGALRSIAGTVPGAGVEISETVPAGARWELVSFRALLSAAAVAVNRFPQLILDDGTTEYYRFQSATPITTGQVIVNVWAEGHGTTSIGGAGTLDYPLVTGNRLGAGHRIKTLTTNLQGADQWSAIQYLVREWLEV